MSDPDYGVPVGNAEEETSIFIRRILHHRFKITLNDLFNTDGNELTPDKIHLPAHDFIFSQPNPTEQQLSDLGPVSFFVGPLGEGERLSNYSRAEQGYVAQMSIPYAVSLLFWQGLMPGGVMDVVETDRPLRDEEYMQRRAERYMGAIKHCIASHANNNRACFTTEPVPGFVSVDEVRIDEGNAFMGQCHFPFNLIQHQIWPLSVGLNDS